MRAIAIVVASALLMPAALHAQVCIGGASYRSGGVSAGVSAERTGDNNLFLGQLGAGKAGRGFASVSAGRATFDSTDAQSTFFGGSVGYEARLTMDKQRPTMDDRLTMCAIAGATYETVTDGVVRGKVFVLNLGVSIGGQVTVLPGVLVVPFAHIALLRTRTSLSDQDDDVAITDSYGYVRFGAGIVVNQRVTLRPTYSMTLIRYYSERSLGLAVQVNFGGHE